MIHYATFDAQMDYLQSIEAKLYAVCGADISIIELDYTGQARLFMEHKRSERCPKCEAHPDLALKILAELPG